MLRISKDRNSKCRIQPIYIQGSLYPKKENISIATTNILPLINYANRNYY